MTVIGVHSIMHLMHPNYCQITIICYPYIVYVYSHVVNNVYYWQTYTGDNCKLLLHIINSLLMPVGKVYIVNIIINSQCVL